MLITAAIIWGAGFVASQLALDAALSASAIMLGRFAIAAVLIFLIFAKSILKNFKRSHLKGGIVIGVLLFTAFFVQTFGLIYSTPSNNAFLTATNVVMVPFLSWGISKQKPKNIFFIAPVLCLIGVGILSIDPTGGFHIMPGDYLTLLCAFLFACQITATGILAPKMDYRVLVFLQLLVAAICSFIAFMITDRNFSGFARLDGMLALLFLGVLSTSACYFLQTKAQVRVSSSTAAILLSTECLFGSIFSVAFGYDRLTPMLVIGGAVIFISVTLPDVVGKISAKRSDLIQ